MNLCEAIHSTLAPKAEGAIGHWASGALLLGLILFALTLPHSIAAAQISLALCLLAWAVRDASARRLHFARTPLDWPLLCFAALTVLSAFASVERDLSLPKLRALLLFLVFYFCATNLQPRGAYLFIALLIASGLVGVGFSLTEKVIGRGMIVTAINADGPLAGGKLQPGDVIWMVSRRRVRSLDDAARIIRSRPSGSTVEIEALHAGDPLPVSITVTDELKVRANPLGITAGGPSRRFRVSGFTRHFITYAEQMQLFALLCFGALVALLRRPRELISRHTIVVAALCFTLFALALLLTASRAAMASCLFAALMMAALMRGKRVVLAVLLAAFAFGAIGLYVLSTTRTTSAVNFNDDSTARRIAYMRAGLRLIPRHPLLGVGMDAHQRHWEEWGFPGDYVTHTHSTPIQIALERGVPALLCFIWLMASMGLMLWRGYRQSCQTDDQLDWLTLGALAAAGGFAASSLVNYNFGDSEALMLLLAVCGAAAVKK